jgi:tubulin--tyrosine ligase
MFTSIGGRRKAYGYEEGYIRTSSYEFDISNLSDRLIHLTNDAVQKRDKNYGKFEAGNKQSYSEF